MFFINRITTKWSLATMALLFSVLFYSCKKEYNPLPELGEPNIVANTTIKQLKAMYTTVGTVVPITDDIIIEGIVNCDDRSGNFYQQIAIQDETGGLLLRIAGNNHYNNYPVGRKIYIKCKGLTLGSYGRMIQLGGGVNPDGDEGTLLAYNLQDQHIIKGALNQPLIPKTVKVSELTNELQDPYVNVLVKLENMEFAQTELGKNYAEATNYGNRIVQGCDNPSTNRVTLRTSNYSTYGNLPLPSGNGDIIGIYSIFNNTKQFTIRDTTDVRFTGTRCTAGGGGTGSTAGLPLTTSPYTQNFDGIGAGLPQGVFVKQEATATALGKDATVYGGSLSAKTAWNQSSLGIKNFASTTGLTGASDETAQGASTNRALGFRQTGTVNSGGDPGVAFAIKLDNTTGKNNLVLNFDLLSLDATITRTVNWTLDYGVGAEPTTFTPLTTTPATLSTSGAWGSTAVSVTLPTSLNNQNEIVWVRLVALANSTGGGSRPSTAIDNLSLSWN